MFKGACSRGDGGTEGFVAVVQCGFHDYLTGPSLHGGKLFRLHETESGHREGREGEREERGREREREKDNYCCVAVYA